MESLVSIIVPVYNVQDYLGKCLDSLTRQTLKEIEIICINDCSTDNSQLILQEYANKDSRIKVINLEENRKQGGARNVGIRLSKSPYLAFVDSDDWVDLTMFETLYHKASECQADLVSCDYFSYHSDTNMPIGKNLDFAAFTLPADKRNRLFLLNGVRLWTCLFQRSLFFDNDLFFPEHLLYEDNAIVMALYLSASTVCKVDIPLYFYRCNNSSTTRSLNNYRFFDRLETSRIFLYNMRRLGFFARYQAEVEYRFIELFYVNTVMVALSQFVPPERTYIQKVSQEMQQLMPRFWQNPYYLKRISWRTRLILSILARNASFGIALYKICKFGLH